MKNLYKFFNKLKENGGAIWLEEKLIKASVPEVLQTQTTKDFVKDNTSLIVSSLNHNGVFSKSDFLNKLIYKDFETTEYPLSFSQQRLWFVERFEEGTNVYHIPTIYKLASDTNIDAVKHALQQIVLRHEVLRTTIDQSGEQTEAIQIVNEGPCTIGEIKVQSTDDYEELIKATLDRPFDLSKEYPIRIEFYNVISAENKT
ncbi:MAG: hypothetical protein HRT71_11040 [Flavobacteriales bacterium]|nr:hypothetical protein [Flavobacteriales bacterium]